MQFRNRTHAGKQLTKVLDRYKKDKPVIYALPRGGVALGVEIAKHLEAPLDLVIARKIGHPSYEEYAVGAVTEDGHVVFNKGEVLGIDPEWLKQEILKEKDEARRRRILYMKGRAEVPVKNKTAIITDDGIATGLTMLAAIREVRDRQPARLIIAVPVISADIALLLKPFVDEIVSLDSPVLFRGSVGSYYDEFSQVTDSEVVALLNGLKP